MMSQDWDDIWLDSLGVPDDYGERDEQDRYFALTNEKCPDCGNRVEECPPTRPEYYRAWYCSYCDYTHQLYR